MNRANQGVVVIDLDGTLLDTRRRHHRAYAEIMGRLGGSPLAAPVFWAAKRRGASWSQVLGRSFHRGPSDLEAKFLAAFRDRIENEDLLDLDELLPGVLTALSRLAAMELEPVIATARRDTVGLSRQLDRLDLKGRVGAVFATGDGPKDAGLGAGYRARAVHWIGDTEQDFAGATRLGIPASLVSSGIRNRRFLTALGPHSLHARIGAAVRFMAAEAPK